MPTTTSTTGYLTARVLEAARLSPSFIRVVLADTGDGRPATSGVPDEIVHLYFPAAGESAPPPMTEVDGVLAHHDPDDARVARNYTVRRWEQGRITINFVDHGTGTAVEWARSARPGMQLGVWGTRAWYQPPADTRWMLLVADLTGVPAMLRILEQLPLGVEARAIAEVAHPADRLPTEGPHQVDWRIAGNGRAPSVLPTAAAEWDAPDGPGYVWFAGEASAGRAIRKQVRGLIPSSRQAIVGYWRDDKEAWLDRYQLVSDDLIARYDELSGEGLSDAEAELRWDEILEQAGL
ncbi:MAG: siderophore-interacting protein [Nocardioides alkalitolerans]